MFKKNYTLSEKILRIGLGLTILWFGFSQLASPSDWTGYLPAWAFSQGVVSTLALVYANAFFESVTAIMLICNQFARSISILLALHMALIIFHLGYNDLAVRDFGLMVGFIALAFMASDTSILNKSSS